MSPTGAMLSFTIELVDGPQPLRCAVRFHDIAAPVALPEQHAFAAVSSALSNVTAAAQQVSELLAQQSTREVLEKHEQIERRVSQERRRAEEAAAIAAITAAEAHRANHEWEQATELAAKVAYSRSQGGLNTFSAMSASRAECFTARATREARAAVDAAKAIAVAADERASEVARQTPWADVGFTLVSEAGDGFSVERFLRERDAHAAASKLWASWVLYRESGTDYAQVRCGGMGWGYERIQRYVETHLSMLKRAARHAARGPPREPAIVGGRGDATAS